MIEPEGASPEEPASEATFDVEDDVEADRLVEFSPVEAPAPTGERYCLGCFYNLRGLTDPRCPECGRAFDPQDGRTFSRSPRPQRLQKLVRRTAAAISEGVSLLRPEELPKHTPSMEWALGRSVSALWHENAELKLYLTLLLDLLRDKGLVLPEELAEIERKVRETGGIAVVDDTEVEAESEASPDLVDLGRAAMGESAGGAGDQEAINPPTIEPTST